MQVRTLLFPAFALVSFGMVGCSSGSGGPASLSQPSCDDGTGANEGSRAFCVVACNLGCNAVGCSISEIAQNQPIRFEFNKPVDPSSVNLTTIQIKTESGEEPVGQFLVSGNAVTFAPDIQVVGNSSFFGFKNGATYALLIREAAPGVPTVRSSSGQGVVRSLSCNLRVSRGIVDLDGAPPRATLVTPAAISDVARDTQIVVEFSEILDRAPFQGNAEDLPVRFLVRRTRPASNGRECIVESDVPLRGAARLNQDTARQISILTMVPADRLPSESCIEVQVTTRVRDVAGTPASPGLFRFTIRYEDPIPGTLVEEFTSQQSLDTERSAGEWSGGNVTPAAIGGSGKHGDFDLALLENVSTNVYRWDLDRDERGGVRGFLIPAARTMTGQDEFVTDGEFHFSRLAIPEDVTIRAVGSHPLRLFVRGRCEVLGTLDLSGASAAPNYPARPTLPVDYPGQPGASGGPGGGAGGTGGALERTMGSIGNPNKPLFDGQRGGAGWVDAEHAYRSIANERGGGGSTQWPASGLNTAIIPSYLGVVSLMAPSPGGGGGWIEAGGRGINSSIPDNVRQPDSNNGVALDVVNLSPLGRSSLVHYLLGGAGGGGGGSHTYFRALGEATMWCAGGGGGGGGGGLLLRVGRELIVGSSAVLDVRGGNGATTTLNSLSNGPATPGGGGSGGTVLVQVGGDYRLAGRTRALGGSGGSFDFSLGVDRITLNAGRGGNGYVRVEALVAPQPTNIGQVEPPPTSANVGALTDRDRIVALQSQFSALSDVFPPTWTAYEIEAEIDGAPVVFSDDPARSSRRAALFTEPIGFVIQGTRESNGALLPPGPWRQFVGPFDGGAGNLNADIATVVRFQLVFNYNRANTIRVRKLTIHYLH